VQRLGGFFVSPNYCTKFVHVFLATGLSATIAEADADEQIAR